MKSKIKTSAALSAIGAGLKSGNIEICGPADAVAAITKAASAIPITPKLTDAGITDAGRSMSADRDLTARQVSAAFDRHPDINHIETPSGYYLRPASASRHMPEPVAALREGK